MRTVFLTAAAWFAAALASAEEAPVVLDPVEITARAGVDVAVFLPSTATVYDEAFLTNNGITDYDELAPVTPGFFVSGQSVDNVSLNLRGLTSDTSDPRVQPRVSVFQDGVALHNAHGNSVALFDTAEVAVLKGPQPTRFGEGVESGALALASNRARDESSGALTVGAGDYDAITAEAYVNRPLIADKLFARVAVYSNQRDGYVKNLADGSDLQGEGTQAVRASLRWSPTAATTADLIFNYQNDDTPGVAFKTAQGVPGFLAITDTDPYSAANLNRGAALGVTRTITGLTGIVKHEFNEAWTVTSTSAWREVDSHNEFDADGTQLYLLELGEIYDGRRLSQEVRFDYDAGGRFTSSLGANAAWSEDGQTTIIRTNENTLFTYFTNGGIFPFPLNPLYEERNRNEAEKTSGDVFGRTDYKFTDKLTLGAGLRLTQERLVSRYQSFAAPVPGNLAGVLPTSGGGNNIFQVSPGQIDNRAEEQAWSGQVDARYAFTPRFTTYASVSRGRRSPVLNFDAVTLAPRQLAEETVVNYELGMNGATANRRVRYGASVFLYDFEHFQTVRTVVPGVTQPIDGGRARGRGFETNVETDVADWLTLFATYGFTDARFADRDEDGMPQDYAGNTFRLTSKHTASVGGTFTVPAGGGGAVFFTPLLTYRSAYYFEDDNAQNGGSLRQGGYVLLNLRLGYRARDGKWEVTGYVNNALGKEYLLDAGNTGGTYGIPTNVPAAPRMAGVTVTMRF
ncbi:MAG: TonB-dependent receptor [Opitutaceae bacterium]|nr:TonB-dependent receptor [Opitutaceae bacterium]